MSSAAVVRQDDLPAGVAKPRRGWVADVILRTVRDTGALIGLAWIAVVGLCAVFAPLLANSFPYLVKTTDGRLISPMWTHLKPSDVILLVLAVVAVALLILFRRWSARLRFWVFSATTVVTIGLGFLFVSPPQSVVYKEYRLMQANGEIAWAVYPPIPFSPSDRLRDISHAVHPTPPTWSIGEQDPARLTGMTHWMGTERTGSDIFSKMIHACRIAMAIGFIATGIGLFIGVIIGGVMGYFSGIVDLLGMRLVEIFQAIPVLFLLLTFVAFFERSIYMMMVILGVTGWTSYARFIRAEFLRLRSQDFIQAARACGLPLTSILFKHMLPNGVTPVLIAASFGVASAILYESTLSFLGLGLVDEPSWGQLLEQATGAGGGFYWWLATFPGMAIFLTVFAYNLVGEALRDAIDPHSQKTSH